MGFSYQIGSTTVTVDDARGGLVSSSRGYHKRNPGPLNIVARGFLFRVYSSVWFLAIITVIAIFIAIRRCERHSAKHFARFRPAKGHEGADAIIAIMIAVSLRKSGGFEAIGDFHQFVRIGALVSARADR